MSVPVGFWTILGVAVFIPLFGARGQDSPQQSATFGLSCKEQCSKRTPPELVSSPPVILTRIVHGHQQIPRPFGAIAEVLATVTVTGEVKNPILLRVLGPRHYGIDAVSMEQQYRYKPATMDGVPVETSNLLQVFTRVSGPLDRDVTDETRTTYGQASDLIQQGKYADADAILRPALAQDQLPFLDRAMISLALAVSYSKQKDYVTAREFAKEATILQNGVISRYSILEPALRHLIELDARTGHFNDALISFNKLKQIATITAGDPAARIVEYVKARLRDPAPIRVVGRVPANDAPQVKWTHILERRHITIPVIEGKLDRLYAYCDQAQSETAISDGVELSIPNNWSNCLIVVTGEPGSSFELSESVK